MATDMMIADAGRNAADMLQASRIAGATQKVSTGVHAKAKAAAEDFEAVFLNTMFQQMFAGLDGEGPFGGAGATGVWRSFLTDQYSRTFAKAGGVGIGDAVYRSLLEQQGLHS
jgi:Rod binding domain-containing protein